MKVDMNKIYWQAKGNVVFYTSKMPYFELSNMYHGMPIRIGEYVFNSSEALYQACKYDKDLEVLPKNAKTDIANVRERILKAKTPMQAKMTQKCAVDYARDDWEDIKVDVMFAVLVLKATQHERFREILLSTGNKDIIEQSKKDRFWGAVIKGGNNNILYGHNVLGQLLMKLRAGLDMYVLRHDEYDEWLRELLG